MNTRTRIALVADLLAAIAVVGVLIGAMALLWQLYPTTTPANGVHVSGLPHVLNIGHPYPYRLTLTGCTTDCRVVRIPNDRLDAGAHTVAADSPGRLRLRLLLIDDDDIVAHTTWKGEAR